MLPTQPHPIYHHPIINHAGHNIKLPIPQKIRIHTKEALRHNDEVRARDIVRFDSFGDDFFGFALGVNVRL